MKIIYFILPFLILLSTCKPIGSQEDYSTINPDSLNFGTYYKIGKYGIEVPFQNKPINTMNNSTDKIFILTCRNLFIFKNDTSILGIEIYRNKDNFIKIDSMKFLNITSHIQKLAIESKYQGFLVNSDTTEFRGRHCMNNKYIITVLYQGIEHKQFYYTTIFSYHGMVICLFAYTPLKDNCKIIVDCFFKKIKISEPESIMNRFPN